MHLIGLGAPALLLKVGRWSTSRLPGRLTHRALWLEWGGMYGISPPLSLPVVVGVGVGDRVDSAGMPLTPLPLEYGGASPMAQAIRRVEVELH